MTRPISKVLTHAWWGFLLISLIVFCFSTERRIDRVEAISSVPTWSVAEPVKDSKSPAGREDGQRRLIVAGHHNASFNWIREAQMSVSEGKWRLREIDYDSFPEGREISRTALYRWWLVSVGWIRGLVSSESLGVAIEQGTLYADPALLAIVMLFGSWYCARTFSSAASIGFAMACLCVFPLAANFQPGAPDSHSLSWVLSAMSLLLLLGGASKTKGRQRIHFVVSGILAGLGVWNEAEAQMPFLLAVALAGLLWEWIEKGKTGVAWRLWAWSGSLAVLAASLFEFAPNHFSWSLDAVHPLHAVFWLGMVELIVLLAVWQREGNAVLRPAAYVPAILGLLGVAMWPVVGLVSESGSLLASDFYAREIANHPAGGLAGNFGLWLGKASGSAKLAALLPILVFVLALFRLVSGNAAGAKKGHYLFLAVVGFFCLALGMMQIRWINLFDTVALVLFAVVLEERTGERSLDRFKQFAPLLLVLPGLLVGFPDSVDGEEELDLTPMEKQALIERDYGYWLRHYGNADDLVLFSTPMFSATSAYYGGFKSVVSGEGDNTKGFETAVRLAAADSLQEVSILLESLQVTHVAIPLWDPMVEHMARLGVGNVAEIPPNVFFLSLRDWDVPYFLRPLNYPTSTNPSFKGYGLPSFALQAELQPDIALSNLADLFVERGQQREMLGIREVLKEYPRSLYALSSVANIDQALGDANAGESLAAVIPYLSRRAARRLPLDRRVTLAVVLFRGQERQLAKEQIEACMELVDADTLRTLTPNAVASLLALANAMDVSFPENSIKEEALSLVPVALRERLAK